MLTDYWDVNAMLFITNYCKQSSGGVVFLVMPKGAYESANPASSAFLWISDENFVA